MLRGALRTRLKVTTPFWLQIKATQGADLADRHNSQPPGYRAAGRLSGREMINESHVIRKAGITYLAALLPEVVRRLYTNRETNLLDR